MKDFARKILDELDLGPGGFADIRFQESESVNMIIKNGITEEVTSNRMGGAAIRALVGGAWGLATTAEITKKSLKAAVKTAVTMAKVASEKIKEPRKIDPEFSTEGKATIDFDLNPKDVSIEEKMKLTQDFEKSIRDVDKRIAMSQAIYLETVSSEDIVSTNGTDVHTQLGVFRISGNATAREGNLQQNVGHNTASSIGIKTIMDYDVVEKGTDAGKKAVDLLSAEKPKSGKMMNVHKKPS